MKTILLTNAMATLFMTGVIWVVQVVHYPLFADVGADAFPAYAAKHNVRITYVVLLPMIIEALTALLLVWQRPLAMPAWLAWFGIALVGIIWLSTFFLQTPQHAVLLRAFDANAHQLLVVSNWMRTVAWSLRSGVILWVLARMLG